jgi:hypothetical protein
VKAITYVWIDPPGMLAAPCTLQQFLGEAYDVVVQAKLKASA